MTEFDKTKTHAIDAISFNKYRAEFRLPSNTVLLSKMSLMNVGVYGDTIQREYIHSTGLKALIKSISLMDGNQVLDSIQHYNKWSAYNEYNNSNDANRDMNNYMSGSGFGFTTNYAESNGSTLPADAGEVETYNRIKHAEIEEADTFKGIISLQRELDFLTKSLIVPTTIFKNLRVVIEFQTNMNKVFKVAPTNHTLLRPFLVCKEVVDEATAMALVKNYAGVQFRALEDDIIPVAEGSLLAVAKQETKRKVNGFNGKMLQSLVIQKEPTHDIIEGVKEFGSVAQAKEKFNLLVNGKKLIPFEGVDRTNKRLGMLHMSQGVHNAVVSFAGVGTSNIALSDNASELVAKADYFGCNIVDRISDLQLEYQRETHNEVTPIVGEYNQALNLNVYGRVNKAVVVNGGKYVVEYQ